MKHRKLFPVLTINQTVDCPDYCSLTCPYGCYEYPDYSIPPPPPPSPISARESYHTPPYMIIILAMLTSFFFLVSCYLIIVKYCSNHFGTPPTQSNGPAEEEFGDENQGPPVDHHIWYISTVGLQPSIINAITVFKYKKGEHLIEGTDCSVCLSEFREGDTLRLLPKCNHAFHIPCIDTWLRSHTNCPSCRTGVVSNTTVSNNSASNDQIAHSSSPNEDTMMENSENYSELDNNSLTCGEICENRVGTEDELELPQVDDERNEFDNSKEVVNSNEHDVFRVVFDLADNKINMEDETQPLRRSISMDSSSSAAHISLAETNFCKVESQGNPAD